MFPIKSFLKPTFVALVLTILNINNLRAQETQITVSTKSEWKFIIEPYMLFPNMNGTVGLGSGEVIPDVDIDASSNDILGQLKMGFMLNAEASNGKWTLGSDLLYMSIAQGVEPSILIENGELSVKQLGWEVSGLYAVKPWLDLGIAGMLSSINSEVDLNKKEIGGGTTTKNKSLTETWFDPMLIARIKSSSEAKIVYMFRAEIGGFGIGSDLAWQLQAYAGYRFSKLFQITGGYRIISIDYESGSGQNRFMYNVDTSGPVLRFGFNF